MRRLLGACAGAALLVATVMVISAAPVAADDIGGCSVGAVTSSAAGGPSCSFALWLSSAQIQNLVVNGTVTGIGLVGMSVTVAPQNCNGPCVPPYSTGCGPAVTQCSTVAAQTYDLAEPLDATFFNVTVTCAWSGPLATLVNITCQGQIRDQTFT